MKESRATAPAYARLSIGARLFATAFLLIPIAGASDADGFLALIALAAVWLATTMVERLGARWYFTVVAEAAAVATVCMLTLGTRNVLLAALVFPAFTAALRAGAPGLMIAMGFQSLVLAASFIVVDDLVAINGPGDTTTVTLTLTWLVAALGLGLIGRYLHMASIATEQDPLAPYRYAKQLIRDLTELSGSLRSGLDPIALASHIAVAVRNELPVIAVTVHVPRFDDMTPLVSSASAASVNTGTLDPHAQRALREGQLLIEDRVFALPLHSEDEVVAVVSGILPDTVDPSRIGVEVKLTTLEASLATTIVHLDTALRFLRLRDTATTEERRRLAREMHDGVAQDIASLGYLVDALAMTPSTPAQAEGLRRLRDRITAVVTEVRRSVQTLRTDADAAESLGAAVSGLARHLSESSGIPIRVTVNERTKRLRPEVEAELLRIAQESMNNAVRHAEPSQIDVSIRVAAPSAEIVVRDDGSGLGPARANSYGLAIMRERASLIDADLSVEPAAPHGTVVTVRVPSKSGTSSQPRSTPTEKVTA